MPYREFVFQYKVVSCQSSEPFGIVIPNRQHWIFLVTHHRSLKDNLIEALSNLCFGIGQLPYSMPPPSELALSHG